ncbi:MAG: TonB family protein [Acidobacteriia bacterium]|nr:TonB family protein [Terriglobia bacterium]
MHVQAVSSLPGLKLPAPEQPTESKVASENEGLYQPPEQVKKPTAEKDNERALALEELKSLQQKMREQRRRQNLPQPPNAVPWGRGGQPNFSYGEFRAGGRSSGGVGFEGSFGQQYAWYARAIIDRISSNFQEQMVGQSVQNAPRVFVTFSIGRDGSVTHIELRSSSGIPTFDAMAIRSIQASNPMPPLPSDYSGNNASVECYFDFRR